MTITKLPAFLHGGDYNPEQWDRSVWDEDIRLMQLAGVNAPTLGVFSWVALEPSEGVYDFSWLDDIIEKISNAGMHFVLATPSAATPQWMSQQYPETLRVRHDGLRQPHKVRVNYCLSSPVYRTAARNMAQALSERYGKHPNLLLWHINNEYHHDCHCDLCQQKFRNWLQDRYQTLDALNAAWWTRFWSHAYTDWQQVRSPQPWPDGEWSIQGLSLDWRRFVAHQYTELFENEASVIREHSPDIPLTHNMHALLNEQLITQWKTLAPHLDVVSWDNYPGYQDDEDDIQRAIQCAFQHSVYRGLNKNRPYLMMESNPGAAPGSKQQRPGALRRTAIQAIGHGSDSVMYFQWRNGRGEIEKFHGSMVEHVGHEHTRQFSEMAGIGQELTELSGIVGSEIPSEVAIIFDQEIHWALELSTNARWDDRDYINCCLDHFSSFWHAGVNFTVVPPEYDLSQYKLVIAPLLHLVSEAAARNLKQYVEQGGCLILTYWSGYVNEHDLCFSGGFPGPLKELCGLWVEELDGIPAGQQQEIQCSVDSLKDSYAIKHFADLIRCNSAQTLAHFTQDYLQDSPALTCNQFGKGQCYYIGFQAQRDFLNDFYQHLMNECAVEKIIPEIPMGLSVQHRHNQDTDFLFIENFSCTAQDIQLDSNWHILNQDEAINDKLNLERRAAYVLQRART